MSKKLFNIISRVMEIESSGLTDESRPEDIKKTFTKSWSYIK